jgi:hypothetical protein
LPHKTCKKSTQAFSPSIATRNLAAPAWTFEQIETRHSHDRQGIRTDQDDVMLAVCYYYYIHNEKFSKYVRRYKEMAIILKCTYMYRKEELVYFSYFLQSLR